MIYECVNKQQYKIDAYHADYRKIEAINRNQAKYIYAKITGTNYCDVLCRNYKGYPQWII